MLFSEIERTISSNGIQRSNLIKHVSAYFIANLGKYLSNQESELNRSQSAFILLFCNFSGYFPQKINQEF